MCLTAIVQKKVYGIKKSCEWNDKVGGKMNDIDYFIEEMLCNF